MCGRFALAQEQKELMVRYGLMEDASSHFSHSPRYNIAPSQTAAIVTNGDNKKLRGMRWGLIPHWAKDKAIGNKMINARSETASEKPSFRDSFKKHRCLIPATGFFEWREDPSNKKNQPYYIKLTDQEIFSFAGLWSKWVDKSTGEEIQSFTILTTEPNDFLKEIHNRMPVILPKENEFKWLDLSLPVDEVQELLKPFTDGKMESFPVARTVNSPRNDNPECIAPL